LSLFWRIFAANTVILVVVAVLLVFSPVTISAPIHVTEALIVAAGLVVSLAANALLLRGALSPLDRLAERMQVVDLLRPGQRLPNRRGVVGRVVSAFNSMLDRLETERQRSAQRALAAQEAERVAIARNLHDEVGQILTGVLLQLGLLGDQAPNRRREIDETKEAVRRALDEVRRISSELRPEMLDHLGLTSALTELSSAFSRRTGIRVERRLETFDGFSPQTELAIYRVAQEALTNVARHAAATRVSLALDRFSDYVELRIADDGCGFPNGAPAEEHGGLRSMRERAVLVGGRLNVASAPSGGVEVRLQVPAKADEDIDDSPAAED
jgi:two-component system, NarL family, sensor histidine kinase UhpB